MASLLDLVDKVKQLISNASTQVNDNQGWFRQGQFTPVQQAATMVGNIRPTPTGPTIGQSVQQGISNIPQFRLPTQVQQLPQQVSQGFKSWQAMPSNILGNLAIKPVADVVKLVSKNVVYNPETKTIAPLAAWNRQLPQVDLFKNQTKEQAKAWAQSPAGQAFLEDINRNVMTMAGGVQFAKKPGQFLPKITQNIRGNQLTAPSKLLVSHEGAPDLKTVAKYKAEIQAGKAIEPIKVIREGAKYGIEDGKHRFEAYRQLGIKDIPIEIVDTSTQALAKSKGLPGVKLQSKQVVPSTSGLPVGIQKGQKTPAIKILPKSEIEKSIASGDILPQRGFAKSVGENVKTPEVLKAELEKIRYAPLSNKETLLKADSIIKKGEAKALEFAKSGSGTDANATALRLIERYVDAGRYNEANSLVESVAPRFTKEGQSIQILASYGRLTPTGAIKYAQNFINKANEANPKLKLKLDDMKTKELVNLAKNVQSLPEGSRERIVATQVLLQKITDMVPSSVGQKIASFQTMMQLLNPKTLVRNIAGNTIFTGAENVSDVVATGLDKVTSLITGKRTKVLPSLGAQGKGFVTGLKQGAEDVRLGIDTSGGVATQFDISRKTFTDPILGRLEKGLGYALRVPDRAAYQAAFNGSLDNQMRAVGAKIPTPEMITTAHADGLYRTFQDNSRLAEIFSGLKKTLNKLGTPDGKFGLGDMILKYPKTPGNILSRGLDYSPAGFLKGIYTATRPLLQGVPFDQKSFVEQLSRGMVGTGLISAGYVLAKNGIITGKSEKDYDIASIQRATGQGQFKINVDALMRFFSSGGKKQDAQNGDTLVSYDWAQPMSLAIAMGANTALGGKLNQALQQASESLQAGVDTLTGQPMIKGITDFAANIKNKGAVGALQTAALDSLSGFVPTLSNQIANLTDVTQRETYNPDVLQEALNKATARIPGLRTGLQPRIDVFGKEMPNFQGSGLQRILDIFVNPAFISKVTENPVAKEVIDIYQRSGETQQAPRVAPQSVEINGVNIRTTPEEYNKYQRYLGTKTDEIFSTLIDDPIFKEASDSEKAEFLANVLKNINSAAKIEIFGNNPKNVPDTVKNIINNVGGVGSVGYSKEGNLKITGGPLVKPTLTGDSAVDKKLISGYNSDINTQQNDLMNLYKSGKLSKEDLILKVAELEKLKITSAKKGKKAKKISAPKIATQKVSYKIAKLKKTSKKKLAPITITSPKKLRITAIKSPKIKLPAYKAPNIKIAKLKGLGGGIKIA